MHTKSQLAAALMMASALLSPVAEAATKTTTTYEIERAWFDTAHLYVLYKEEIARVRYSLSDVHGSILSEKSNLRISSYSRPELSDGSMIPLKSGDSAESVVYKDADFVITNVSRSQIVMSGKKIEGSVPICQNQAATGWPMESQDGIFFCGALYSPLGNVSWSLPESVLQAIKTGLKSTAPSLISTLAGEAKAAYCFEGKGRLSAVAVSVNSASLKIATWVIGTNDVSWNSVAVGPPGSTALAVNGVMAYSPNRIVLKVQSGGDVYWAECRKEECTRISDLVANGSYLLLDDEAAQAVAISIPDLTKPRMNVQIRHSDNH